MEALVSFVPAVSREGRRYRRPRNIPYTRTLDVYERRQCNRRRCNNIREHLIRNTECESIPPAPSDRFGQCTRTGLQPSSGTEVHPIPRRAINNIPILDTIHLEINRQPIGKPGQIDFEIDNLRSLARALTRLPVHSFVRSLVSFYSSGLFFWRAPGSCDRR